MGYPHSMANPISHSDSDWVTVHRAAVLEAFLAPNWPDPRVTDLALAAEMEVAVLSDMSLHVDLATVVPLLG